MKVTKTVYSSTNQNNPFLSDDMTENEVEQSRQMMDAALDAMTEDDWADAMADQLG